jgi:hypothetical protein
MPDLDAAQRAWADAVSLPDWPERLAAAVTRATATIPHSVDYLLRGITVERSGDAAHLLVRYAVDGVGEVGLRWSADAPPPTGSPSGELPDDLATMVASWIVRFELGEPLGTYAEQLEPDADGVGWWGAGYTVP